MPGARLYSNRAHDGGLQTAEAEVVAPGGFGDGEAVGAGITGAGGAFNRGTARERQAEHAPDFIEGFASGIVDGAAQALIAPMRAHQQQLAVPARSYQRQKREVRLGEIRRQPQGIDMPLQVVDAQQGQAGHQRQALGEIDADQQRAHQPRSLGDGDGVKGVIAQRGLPQRFCDNGADSFGMGAGGELGEDAAILGVQVNLRGDDSAFDVVPVLDDGGGGFVAGGFDGEDCAHAGHCSAESGAGECIMAASAALGRRRRAMYKSFRVKNFRCFKDLQMNDLGRVNLIAGKNNYGKTALMEAAVLLSRPLTPNLLLDLLTSRGLTDSNKNRRDIWQQIFYRLDTSCEIELYGFEHESKERGRRLSIVECESMESNHEHFANYIQVAKQVGYFQDGFIDSRGASLLVYSFSCLDSKSEPDHVYLASKPELPFITKEYADKIHVYFPAEARRNAKYRADIFSTVERHGDLPKLIHYLNVFEPGLLDLRLQSLSGNLTIWGRVNSHQIPLRLMGTGLNRFADIAMSFIVQKPAVVFIDEIENGIHHSIHMKVWQAIGQLARELDIQVFATTHSLEMIRAAYEAFTEAGKLEDFRYHRLDRDDETGDIEAVTYNELDLHAVATFNFDFEVRG